MTATPKILVFAGSTRILSWNKKLAKLAAAMVKEQGAVARYVDLKDYPMPLFDQDLEDEQGIEAIAGDFKSLVKQHDGLIIASPEYNGSFSGVLKNTIDWASRAMEGEGALECFKGKVVLLISTSPGALGGIRGLSQLRMLLSGIGCIVLPDQMAIGKAGEAFNEAGLLNKPKQIKNLQRISNRLIEICDKLKAK